MYKHLIIFPQKKCEYNTWSRLNAFISEIRDMYERITVVLPTVYMSNPNLPVRCEIFNTGATTGAYFDQICSTVLSEGGYVEAGQDWHRATGNTKITITDAGGPTDTYNNNLDQTVTLTPSDNTKKLQLDFSSFNVEAVYDFLYVYDGPNTSSPLLATLNGTSLPATITAENASGQLTLKFTSDISGIRVGLTNENIIVV